MFEHFLIWEGDMAAAGVRPCGMLSPTHLVVTLLCLAVVVALVVRTRGFSEDSLRRIVRYIALPISLLECGKIAFNWAHGGFTPNNWLPLTFCSFSIYAYWMIGFGGRRLQAIGKGYICGGGIIGGLTFLVIPMTSVATYPMLHYLSCYSMLFHSVMMFVGLAYVTNGYYRFNMHGYIQYLAFALPACLIAQTVNVVYGLFDNMANCNMMFLSNPFRLADLFPFVGAIHEAAPFVYTLGAFAVYLTIPYLLPYGVTKLVACIKRARAPESPEDCARTESAQ